MGLLPNPMTSSFAGKDAGFYISAALKSAKSLEYLTVMENVKYKASVTRIEGASLIADQTCGFDGAGTLTLSEKIITPKALQINVDLCKTDLLASWEANQMGSGAWNREAPDFNAYVMSYLAASISAGIETSIWSGADTTGGQFEGFLTATTGQFAVDGTVGTSTATAPYDASNIIANLQQLVADIPAAVYGTEDLLIYMNQKTYRFYISAISTLGYVNAYNMNGDYVPMFEGVKLAVTNGLPDNQMVAAQKSNLFFGCDLLSDVEVKFLDMSTLDGSDNLRVIAKYTGGVQLGVGADITHQS